MTKAVSIAETAFVFSFSPEYKKSTPKVNFSTPVSFNHYIFVYTTDRQKIDLAKREAI